MGIHLIKASQHIYWLQMIPSRTDRLVLDAMAMQALDTPSKDGDPPKPLSRRPRRTDLRSE